MKTRIAGLALALAFATAPALSAFAAAGCMPCGDMAQGDAPCTSLSAASCCGDMVPAAPVKTAPEAPTLHVLAALAPIGSAALLVATPLAPSELAATTSLLRRSVVRRL
jgi:hypothetical protein